MATSLRNNYAVALSAAALTLMLVGSALAFYWVPNAPVEGFRQRIFYIHVPLALTAYACFAWAAWKGFRLLWTREERYDLESYTAVHLGVIFGIVTLATGSIWARTSWNTWWSWGSRQLVLFLVLFLFYCTYFMLRYSTDPGPRRANMSAVYALFGVVLIPISFLAIRLFEDLIHPVVFDRDIGENLTASQITTFVICLVGALTLAGALYANELRGKRIDERLHELGEATG